MSERHRNASGMEARATLQPLTASNTLHWDGAGIVCQDVQTKHNSEHAERLPLQAQWQLMRGRRVQPSMTMDPGYLISSPPPPPIDCDKEAVGLTFFLPPHLLLTTMRDLPLGATGALVWVQSQGECVTPAVRPMLLVHAAYDTLQREHIELVPHLSGYDPLLHHIVLVLQAESAADSMASRLYAEALANALAVHLLRRCAGCRQSTPGFPDGLSPAKLRRTTEYIEAHLEQELPVTALAAAAQTSSAHFARMFKQATGQTPHHYVIMCRIERAKQLLVKTDLSLSEIAHQVGCTDQSHLTALFRRHVSTTPKAYRDGMGR